MVNETIGGSELAVLASLKIRSDKLEAFKSALAEVARATRSEPGCLMYEAYTDLKNPEAIVLAERWAGPEAMAEHLQMPHAKSFVASLSDYLSAPPEITRLSPLVL